MPVMYCRAKLHNVPSKFAALAYLFALPAASLASFVAIENTSGEVSVRVTNRDDLDVQSWSEGRPLNPGDVEIEQRGGAGFFVRARPADGRTVHLEVEVPYYTSLGISTTSGKISVEGMPTALDIETETGNLDLALPWYSSFLDFQAREAPVELRIPDHLERKATDHGLRLKQHRRVGRQYRGYSEVRVRTDSSRRVELREIPIPDESPIKLHWQAPDVLQRLFRRDAPAVLRRRDDSQSSLQSSRSADFHAEVRLVELLVHAKNKRGGTIADLVPEEFMIYEDGEPQLLRSAVLGGLPLNIVVFIDWSGSMAVHRTLTVHAVDQFVRSARDQDAIAVHVCFRETVFGISRLTNDPTRLRDAVKKLDALNVAGSKVELRGSSPIWDAAFLAAADEIPNHDRELNVFIAITDGIDYQSRLSFQEFRRAAREMNMIVYPIVPDSSLKVRGDRFQWSASANRRFAASQDRCSQGRARLEDLARATGGRVFSAASPKQLGSVLQLIIAELGSAYSLAYSPSNRNYDGEWRSNRVETTRPDAALRYRPGYFAHP